MRLSIFRLGIFLTIVLNLMNTAGAVPNIPMIVSGSVYVNGAPAPAGTAIKAINGGALEGSTLVLRPGTYGITVDYKPGLVEFYVNDAKAQSITWSSDPQTLNLTVTVASQATSRVQPGSPISAAVATPASGTPGDAAAVTAKATDTVIPSAQPAFAEPKSPVGQDPQKRDALKSPGYEAFIVLMVLLASRIINGRK